MRLKKFLLRYFPPGKYLYPNFLLFKTIFSYTAFLKFSGIGLEYVQNEEVKTKMIDLLDLTHK